MHEAWQIWFGLENQRDGIVVIIITWITGLGLFLLWVKPVRLLGSKLMLASKLANWK